MKPPRSRRFAFILIVWALAVWAGSAAVAATTVRYIVKKGIEEIKAEIRALNVPEEKKANAIGRIEKAEEAASRVR